MTAGDRLLIETLVRLAQGEKVDIEGGDLSDHLRANFLLVKQDHPGAATKSYCPVILRGSW